MSDISRFKGLFIFVAGLITGSLLMYVYSMWKTEGALVSPLSNTPIIEKELPYKKYAFNSLVDRQYPQGRIEIGRVIKEHETYTSYLFTYMSDGKKISGQLNLPNLSRLMHVIVMSRGYADKENYITGLGTQNAAAYYADKGYITLAPDFAGFGESDPEDEYAIGARLVKPVNVIDLIASLPSLPQADVSHVYLWGHSNGGQITLSVLEILGKKGGISGVTIKGATLWAPVSKPFPYSVLFYSDESDDKGKWLRSEFAGFEKDYDVYDFSIDRYLDWITTPVQLHQGTADPEVLSEWSKELVTALREKEKEVTYHVYHGADHNLKGAWDSVVARDVEFFTSLD